MGCVASVEIKIHDVLWTRSSFQMLREDCWDVIWLTCSGCLSFGNNEVGGQVTCPRWIVVMRPNTDFSSLHTPNFCSKEQGLCGLCVFWDCGSCSGVGPLRHFWAASMQVLHLGIQTTFPAWICPQNYSWWLVIFSLILSPYFCLFFFLSCKIFCFHGWALTLECGLWHTECSS